MSKIKKNQGASSKQVTSSKAPKPIAKSRPHTDELSPPNVWPDTEPTPGSELFDYRVAYLAFYEGLTTNAITKKLNLPSKPAHLMAVKRALKHAHGRYLRFMPPVQTDLKEKLEHKINNDGGREKAITFHVVDDRWGPPHALVCARAAELASSLIVQAVREARSQKERQLKHAASVTVVNKQTSKEVIICNAGGRTISEMVKSMLKNPPQPIANDPESSAQGENLGVAQLRFVAGNSAYLSEVFHQSANFLSVSMAEMFGAKHRALPAAENDPGFSKEEYESDVSRASLLICGVGARNTGLLSQYFSVRGWTIPDDVVGDIAFNPLNARGRKVVLEPEIQKFMDEINPALTVDRIREIKRVLLVLDDAEDPIKKTAISVAALRCSYATEVVLGARLAGAILAAY